MRPTQLTFAAALVALLAAAPGPTRAEEGAPRLQVALLGGGWLATGAERSQLANAPLTGLQLAADLCPWAGLVGTVQWVPTTAKQLGDARVDLFQYDLALRGQHAFPLSEGLALRPFLGVGMGARTVSFHDAAFQGGTGFAWHTALGAELLYRSLVAGLTARHQLYSPNTSALGDGTQADVALYAAAGWRF